MGIRKQGKHQVIKWKIQNLYAKQAVCYCTECTGYFGSLMVSGIFIHIALQVILNIAVVVNLMQYRVYRVDRIPYGRDGTCAECGKAD